METTRRKLVSITGTAVVAALSGCGGGGSSLEEIETGIEETNEHLQAVDPALETAATRIDDRDWEGCFSAVETIRTDLDAARESSSEALTLAEEEGHTDHVAVLERQREYLAILARMADELERACEAGRDGNGAELERRWETIQQLDDDRHAKRREIEAALNELR